MIVTAVLACTYWLVQELAEARSDARRRQIAARSPRVADRAGANATHASPARSPSPAPARTRCAVTRTTCAVERRTGARPAFRWAAAAPRRLAAGAVLGVFLWAVGVAWS